MPWPLDAANPPRRIHGGHLRPRLFLGFRHRFRVLPPPALLLPSPGEIPPPGIEVPSPSTEDQPLERPPLPHGFALTVPLGNGPRPTVPVSLRRFIEVGQALGSCWDPPAEEPWTSITLRVSFRRDGSVNGMPRVPFVDAAGPEQKSELADSLLAALKRCTPLSFSPSLGAAIAGEIFAIRFVNQDAR